MNAPQRFVHKYTYREYQYFPDDGNRHEVIDGDHYMSPAPSAKHQTASRRLQFQLYRQIEEMGLGLVFDAPFDVELAPHDIVQPDLIVIMNDRRHILTPKRAIGVPNLIIEILSDSNPAHDRVLKFEMYQRVGLPEYWIVDPDAELIEQWVLDNEQYKMTTECRGHLACITLPGIAVELDSLWKF
jgi:Uma2 family endonuclease